MKKERLFILAAMECNNVLSTWNSVDTEIIVRILKRNGTSPDHVQLFEYLENGQAVWVPKDKWPFEYKEVTKYEWTKKEE